MRSVVPSGTSFSCRLRDEWLDVTGHLSIFGFHSLFAESIVQFLKLVEIDEQHFQDTGHSALTSESSIAIYRQVNRDSTLVAPFKVIDLTNNAVQLVIELKDASDKIYAKYESILVSVKISKSGTVATPFGRYQLANLVHLLRQHKTLPSFSGIAPTLTIKRTSNDSE